MSTVPPSSAVLEEQYLQELGVLSRAIAAVRRIIRGNTLWRTADRTALSSLERILDQQIEAIKANKPRLSLTPRTPFLNRFALAEELCLAYGLTNGSEATAVLTTLSDIRELVAALINPEPRHQEDAAVGKLGQALEGVTRSYGRRFYNTYPAGNIQ